MASEDEIRDVFYKFYLDFIKEVRLERELAIRGQYPYQSLSKGEKNTAMYAYDTALTIFRKKYEEALDGSRQ